MCPTRQRNQRVGARYHAASIGRCQKNLLAREIIHVATTRSRRKEIPEYVNVRTAQGLLSGSSSAVKLQAAEVFEVEFVGPEIV